MSKDYDKISRRGERREREIAEESRRTRDLDAYRAANNLRSDNPIRISEISYTKFEG